VWDYQAWTGFSGGALGIGYTFVPDAFSYGTSAVGGWLCTAQSPSQIYYVDITNRTWTLKHTWSTGWNVKFRTSTLLDNGAGDGGADASFGFANHFMAAIYRHGAGAPGQGVRVCYTTDNSTFTEADVTTAASTAQGQPVSPPGVFVSSRTALKARVSAPKTASNPYMYGSSNFSSWTDLFSLGMGTTDSLGSSLHCPWDPSRNSAETILFYGNPGATVGSNLFRANDTTVTNIGITNGGALGINQPRNGISTFTGNANRMLVCLGQTAPQLGAWGEAYLTNNALASSPTYTQLTIPSFYNACAIAGDSGSTFYFWGGNYGDSAAVGYSVNGGSTIIDQSGNLSSFTPGKVAMLVGW